MKIAIFQFIKTLNICQHKKYHPKITTLLPINKIDLQILRHFLQMINTKIRWTKLKSSFNLKHNKN